MFKGRGDRPARLRRPQILVWKWSDRVVCYCVYIWIIVLALMLLHFWQSLSSETLNSSMEDKAYPCQNSIYVGMILSPPQKGGTGIFSSPSNFCSTSFTLSSSSSRFLSLALCREAQAPILDPRILKQKAFYQYVFFCYGILWYSTDIPCIVISLTLLLSQALSDTLHSDLSLLLFPPERKTCMLIRSDILRFSWGFPIGIDYKSFIVQLLKIYHSGANPSGGQLCGGESCGFGHCQARSIWGLLEPFVELDERVVI